MADRKTPHPETCPKCPHRYSKVGCPFWITPEWGVVEEDPGVKGSARITTGCLWRHFPRWVSIMIAQTNRPAAAMESARNTMADIVDGLRKDVARVNRVMIALQMQHDGKMLPGMETIGALEHKENGKDDEAQ